MVITHTMNDNNRAIEERRRELNAWRYTMFSTNFHVKCLIFMEGDGRYIDASVRRPVLVYQLMSVYTPINRSLINSYCVDLKSTMTRLF